MPASKGDSSLLDKWQVQLLNIYILSLMMKLIVPSASIAQLFVYVVL